uniref:Tctex1 domain-containing protein 2 n=1 Tax=Mantoniella antarctica TaxID=81844 RepID=A0A7S0SLD6_9CHLO|mmetsp:Transcript_45341/g.72783  ORF Transcript_45341/g.72783 Transcript_45341/m.72783 type:complete len:126 (-) Transcript_45341:423-800(-)
MTTITMDGGIPNVTVPPFDMTFRPSKVKEIIGQVLKDKLEGVVYHADNTSLWCREISDEIKHKLKTMGLERYKFVVQVVIGEQKGEGVRMGCRCFWDPKTDNYAEEVFNNESIFAVAAAFGVYLY